MVTDSIQLSHFFEVVGAREATGVCMQDLVFIRNGAFVCTCSADPTSSLADLKLNDTTFLSDQQWTRIAGKELRMWCNRWRLPDRVRSGLMYWMQHQLLLHHRALQSDCHELHREVNHDLRVMQGLVFTLTTSRIHL